MIVAALVLTAQLANPGFEQGLQGWQTDRHRGMGIGVESNRGYTIRQSAVGEHYLAMGWRARNSAPPEAEARIFQRLDARRYRGRRIRVSVQTRAPDFAHGNGTLTVTAGGATARVGIATSREWRRHAATMRIPRRAQQIEVAFRVAGTGAELGVDDVRLVVLR